MRSRRPLPVEVGGDRHELAEHQAGKLAFRLGAPKSVRGVVKGQVDAAPWIAVRGVPDDDVRFGGLDVVEMVSDLG
jgi:hypothetical protein